VSRRARDTRQRSKQVFVRLNAQEYDDLATAAMRAELTTTGFVAEAALAAARGHATPMDPAAGITRAELKELQRELIAARAELGRIGNNLNQAVRVLNAIGRAPTWLDDVVVRCGTALGNLDAVVAEVDGRLR
jgi:hypothetical protein